MQLLDASRIIDVIDQRIRKLMASAAMVETTWGTVAAVAPYGRYADVYLYGEAAPYASEYFRLPNGLAVSVGDSVKVAIDKGRGDRWVEEVHSFPAYNKVEFDLTGGAIELGSGSAAQDVRLARSGTKTLTVDDAAGGSATVNVVGTLQQGGVGVSLTSHNHSGVYDPAGTGASAASSAVTTHEAAADPHTGYQKESEKNAANGYLGLDSSGTGFLLGADVNLYRSAANVLATDDALSVTNAGGKTTLALTSTGADTGITLAADTNLYRSAANVLKTDDTLAVASFVRHGSASFPASPATNDLYYRTDHGMWFVYDGTRWVCTCPHESDAENVGITWPISASTGAGLQFLVVPDRSLDIYVDKATCFFFVVSGGTALSALHKWDVSIRQNPSSTNLTTLSISSGSSAAYRWISTTPNVVVDMTSADVGFDVGYTKTGTPGNLRASVSMSFRYVAA